MTPRSPSLPTPKTLKESAKYYEQLFAECLLDTQEVMRMYMNKREEIRKKNPQWVVGTIEEKIDYADVRIALFTKQINNLITTCFHLVLYNKSLCNLDWLKQNVDQSYSAHLNVMEKQFDNCFKFAAGNYFHSMFHLMESSFRIFIRHLHSDGKELAVGKFQRIYLALFKLLDIKDRQEKIHLMEFMSVIRNGMHTNWVYVPTPKTKERRLLFKIGSFVLLKTKLASEENERPREFIYKGKSYKLVPNKMMNFLTWKMMMSFAKDILELLDEIVNHQQVISITAIHE